MVDVPSKSNVTFKPDKKFIVENPSTQQYSPLPAPTSPKGILNSPFLLPASYKFDQNASKILEEFF